MKVYNHLAPASYFTSNFYVVKPLAKTLIQVERILYVLVRMGAGSDGDSRAAIARATAITTFRSAMPI